MIVLTYDCDSEYLKVLFSSKISSNGNISIEHNVSPSDSRVAGKKVPILLKNDETLIETGNAIVLHLLPPPDELKESANTWIQWEHTQLSPQLILFGNGEGSEDNLTSLLGHLEQFLTNNYLLGDVISAADICVGCALYPLLSDYNEHSQNLFSSFNNIVSWFNRISSLPEFKECEKKVEVGLNSLPKSRSSDFEEITKNSVEEIVKIWENCATSCRPKPKERIKPVLPKPGEKNVLITSALPYVNNVPHLGNIIGCVLSADVFSRFCRLRNWNTLFICGTDEYGTATETKALDEGLTPQEICDKYFAIHSEIYQWFNIDFDLFGRTTTQNQKEVVQQMFKDCYDNGYTLTEVMDQLLCENCDRFLADRFVEGICPKCKFIDARGDQCDGCGQLINAVELIEPKCKQCRNTPVVRQSQQLFLDLPKIEPKLKEWIEKTSKGWTHNARVITKSWLREGLKPRCITRDLKWGIPVPLSGFESKVFYVWFDAPIGYMSMTKSYTDEWLNWWKPSSETPVSLYQFMAKDNVPFHSIMFPATLFATHQNFITVNHLMATEYLNYEDGKFSKSRGVGVFGTDAKETGIPSDIYRFYLLYVRPESQDSSFSWADLAAKNNTDLLNNLGNFVNRALMFSAKFFNSEIPQITLTDEEKQLIGIITRELVCYVKEIECGRLREGVKYLLNISRHGNQYIQANQPWVLIKGSAEEKERAGTVTGFACQLVCLLTVLLHPYMPEASDTLKKQTNFPEECFVIPDKFLPYLLPGHKIGKPVPLFTKIEPATVEALKQKYAGKQKSSTPEKTLEPEMSVEELEKAIENQGQLVRSLKESGKGKDVWQPEVTKLLDLKKSLANLSANKTSIPNGAPVNVAELEKMVSEQGEKVRVLKQGGSDKAAIKDEVSILLDLKNKLSLAKGEPVQTSGKKKKK